MVLWQSAARQLLGQLPRRRLLPGRCSSGVKRRFCSGGTAGGSAASEARPTFAQLRRHFVCCAVPMVGFGIMDNSILIHAGDNIERVFGVQYSLTGLEAAACGQIFSDFSGVCFGGVIESVSRRYIAFPGLTQSQAALRMTMMVGTAGAAIGVVTGCIIGMGNLLIIDRGEAERLKKLAELDSICQAVMLSAVNVMGCPRGTLFFVDKEAKELFSRSTIGYQGMIRRPLDENASIASWCAINRKPTHTLDVQNDQRYCADIDKLSGITTTEMLCWPVYACSHSEGGKKDGEEASHDDQEVIAVIQFVNKPGGFHKEDMLAMQMLCEHTAIFIDSMA